MKKCLNKGWMVVGLIAGLFCQACTVGTSILYDDADESLGDFSSLHTVPDKSISPDRKKYMQARRELQQQNEEPSQSCCMH